MVKDEAGRVLAPKKRSGLGGHDMRWSMCSSRCPEFSPPVFASFTTRCYGNGASSMTLETCRDGYVGYSFFATFDIPSTPQLDSIRCPNSTS